MGEMSPQGITPRLALARQNSILDEEDPTNGMQPGMNQMPSQEDLDKSSLEKISDDEDDSRELKKTRSWFRPDCLAAHQ